MEANLLPEGKKGRLWKERVVAYKIDLQNVSNRHSNRFGSDPVTLKISLKGYHHKFYHTEQRSSLPARVSCEKHKMHEFIYLY